MSDAAETLYDVITRALKADLFLEGDRRVPKFRHAIAATRLMSPLLKLQNSVTEHAQIEDVDQDLKELMPHLIKLASISRVPLEEYYGYKLVMAFVEKYRAVVEQEKQEIPAILRTREYKHRAELSDDVLKAKRSIANRYEYLLSKGETISPEEEAFAQEVRREVKAQEARNRKRRAKEAALTNS